MKLIADLLVVAASTVVAAPGRQPWNYGWFQEGYRNSESAALSGPSGPMTLTGEGIKAYEDAVARLLRDPKVAVRWDGQEFWGLVAVTVVLAASEIAGSARQAFVEEKLNFLRNARKALSLQLVANVTWNRAPILFGDSVIGNADEGFFRFVNASSRGRIKLDEELWRSWAERYVAPRITDDVGSPVAIACWTTGQDRLAFDETDRQLRNIVDLALFLERDLESHKIYRRGDVNRPGIRGLVLDRGAVERGLDGNAKVELSAPQFTITDAGDARSLHWFGSEPLPLGELYGQVYLREAVQSCLKNDPIARRMRVASRWYSEAHFTLATDDAALALGVAMDALLTGKGSLPGSVMADRVAALSDEPAKRPGLVKEYLDLYHVRSSVAHGGQSSKLSKEGFMKDFADFVRWIAWRFLAIQNNFSPSSDAAVDALFNDLRWGVKSWSN